MNGKRILFVSSELVPYLPENPVSLMSYEAPKMVNSNGGQIRIFMPRYGNINERRHQLHEVIWMASLLPLYLRKYYADEPLFADSKIVTSIYDKGFEGELDKNMGKKILFDGIEEQDIEALSSPDYNNLLKIAVDHSDAIILASEEISDELQKHIEGLEKPVLPYVSMQETEEAYSNFYKTEVLK